MAGNVLCAVPGRVFSAVEARQVADLVSVEAVGAQRLDLFDQWAGNFSVELGRFGSVRELISAVGRSGSSFFDAHAVRFFGAKVYDLYGGGLLVHSVLPPDGVREYRVSVFDFGTPCECCGRGPVASCRDLADFPTLRAARAFAADLARRAAA